MKMGQARKPVIVKEYHLDIGKVQVFDNYMVSIFNEGITITLEKAYQLLGIAEIHFREKDFGYISFRKNSYALDPMLYNYVKELDGLKAMAIVSVKDLDMHNFKIEKMFFKKPMEFFIEYDNAVTWLKKEIKSKKK